MPVGTPARPSYAAWEKQAIERLAAREAQREAERQARLAARTAAQIARDEYIQRIVDVAPPRSGSRSSPTPSATSSGSGRKPQAGKRSSDKDRASTSGRSHSQRWSRSASARVVSRSTTEPRRSPNPVAQVLGMAPAPPRACRRLGPCITEADVDHRADDLHRPGVDGQRDET